MQEAATVLGIIRNRGERGLPLKNLYRQLYNPQFYFQAYVRLYSNDGAMTADTTGETVDGMSKEKIKTIIDLIRHERWRWTPHRRTYPHKIGSCPCSRAPAPIRPGPALPIFVVAAWRVLSGSCLPTRPWPLHYTSRALFAI